MHSDWNFELKNLETVNKAISDELQDRIKNNDNFKSEMRTINKEMWENAGALAGHSTMEESPTFIQDIAILKQKIINSKENKKRIYMLEKQSSTPYFCRIDFKEDDYIEEKIYIGIYGLRIADTGEILVYDWRAPISSIFYDYEPGRVSYNSPSGVIEGDLFQKRQYRIESGRLIFMFDSSIAIEDDILQEILAKNSNNKMKTIVSTIQREQNHVIRYEGKRVMLVQGPAGSGKTSIALHRAAYLLYRFRDTIKAENILLYTPNSAFIEYISSVLPELGEEELKCTTLVDFTKNILGNKINKYESYSEMMEWKLTQNLLGKNDNRLELIKFKATKEFVDILDKFITIYENKILNFKTIKRGEKIFFTKEDIDELFYKTLKQMPVYKRLFRIKKMIMKRIGEYEKQIIDDMAKELSNDSQYISNSERKAVSRSRVKKDMIEIINDIDKMFSIDILEVYIILFKEADKWDLFNGLISKEVLNKTVKSIENRILFYEDQAPIVYLMSSLGMIDIDRNVKHVIIDEAQDYSIVAFKFFSNIYRNSNITILGDVNQNINPLSGIGNLDLAGEIVDENNFEYIKLNKSYRSTLEIMNFASKIISSKTIAYGRKGKSPNIIIENKIKDLCDNFIKLIREIKEEYKTIAVICRTLSDCNKIYDYIESDMNISFVKSGEDEILEGINIIPSYLSKGMEFDAVIVTILSEDDYMNDEDQLLYTVLTRALHRLEIYSINNTRILERLKR